MKNYFPRSALACLLTSVALCTPTTGLNAQTVGFADAGHRAIRQSDFKELTDRRIDVVKNALQLTAEQEKYWPPIEEAIRLRAKGRQTRLADLTTRLDKFRESGPLEILSNPNPIEFLNWRSKQLGERAAEAKKVADAWQPLYQTLKVDQKQRMTFVLLYVLHEIADRAEEQSMQIDEE
jgi:hypothetical protein